MKHFAYSISISLVTAFLFQGCVAENSEEQDKGEGNIVPYTAGSRIAWDYSTRQKVYDGQAFYPRIIRLEDGSLLAAFESEGAVLVTKSIDDSKSWQEIIKAADSEKGINAAVPELIQLKNGHILLAYNTRPPQNNQDQEKKFGIKIKISEDRGQTWGDEINIYEGGHEWSRGVWEPAMIQLSSGEIHLFFANEHPYENNDDQEISLTRSSDNGLTWSEPKTVSYRQGHRDGMPVPLILQDEKGIVAAIEDNGLYGNTFKPAILTIAVDENGPEEIITGDSDRRWGALSESRQILASSYGGAPYLRQLKTGETVLSFQTNEGRAGEWGNSTMAVAIGDNEAKNFSKISEPFEVPEGKSALWNSLFIKNDTTVTAISSTNAFSSSAQSEFYIIEGYLNPDLQAPYGEIEINGDKNENTWQQSARNFLGAYSEANLSVQPAWNEENLYLSFSANGINTELAGKVRVEDDPGIFITLATRMLEKDEPEKGSYKIKISSTEEPMAFEGNAGNWQELEMKVFVETRLKDPEIPGKGYTMELAIPWDQIGGIPKQETAWGINIGFINRQSNSTQLHKEVLSGTEENKPSTWAKVQFKR